MTPLTKRITRLGESDDYISKDDSPLNKNNILKKIDEIETKIRR